MSSARVVIAGVPKAGKTTLAQELRTQWPHPPCRGYLANVAHTDDLIGGTPMAWSAVSATVATWFDAHGPWLVEGVRAVHALRKWLAAHPEGKPADRVVWLDAPRVPLERGQTVMAAGCRTVWREVRPVLLARNVHVEEP